jgi:hypothetical protein
MKELFHLIRAKANTSTTYHPRTDGQSERTNQFLGQFLRPWVNVQQDNWEPYLPIAEFAHNSWHSEMTRQSPFSILMGYEPQADISNTPTSLPILELRREVWKKAREDTHKFILQAQQRWVQSKKERWMFKAGDHVWLEGHNLHLDQPSAKLSPKCHGPPHITARSMQCPFMTLTSHLLPSQLNCFGFSTLTIWVMTVFVVTHYSKW